MEVVKDIGKIKAHLDMPIKNEMVERAKLEQLSILAKDMDISPDLIQVIYLLIINYSIGIQEDLLKSENVNKTFFSNRIGIFSHEKASSGGLE